MNQSTDVLATEHNDNISVDHGCDLAPACLKCPFSVCRHDDPGIVARERYTMRAAARRKGESVLALARQHELSERSIYRIAAGENP